MYIHKHAGADTAKKTTSENLWPELINSFIHSLKSREVQFSKNRAERGFFFASSAAKIWKRDIGRASEKAFLWRCFWLLNTLHIKIFKYTRIHSPFVNDVVTASSHAL